MTTPTTSTSDSLPRLVLSFPSCATDLSGGVWPEELAIIRRMQLGQRLVVNRHYLEVDDNYGVSWYWNVEPVNEARRWQLSVKAWNRCCEGWMQRWYPRQWDGPVMRLIGREILKVTTCGGGYSTMEFTMRAARLFTPQNTEITAK